MWVGHIQATEGFNRRLTSKKEGSLPKDGLWTWTATWLFSGVLVPLAAFGFASLYNPMSQFLKSGCFSGEPWLIPPPNQNFLSRLSKSYSFHFSLLLSFVSLSFFFIFTKAFWWFRAGISSSGKMNCNPPFIYDPIPSNAGSSIIIISFILFISENNMLLA